MSNLLDAANVSINKDEFIVGKLPTEPGEASIMTLKDAYIALEGVEGCGYDPSYGYNKSTYYMYAIDDVVNRSVDDASRSTSADLQDISIDWYKQLNKPTISDKHWPVGSHKVFGGPLLSVDCSDNNRYSFNWYYSESDISGSDDSYYWLNYVAGSVYVAIVHS